MSSGGKREPSDGLRGDLTTIEEAYRRASDRIEQEQDPDQALEDAAHLANSLRAVANSAAELRTWAVRPVWDREQMPLSQLAERIGVSKGRADQITRTFRANPSQEEEQ